MEGLLDAGPSVAKLNGAQLERIVIASTACAKVPAWAAETPDQQGECCPWEASATGLERSE